jgi:hypothetical protein
MGRAAPKTATLKQPLSKLILHLACLACCLVLQTHRLLDSRDLQVRELARPVTDNRSQWPPRHEEVDKITAEGIGGPAQCVQADSVSGLRLLQPCYRSTSDTQPRAERGCAHTEGFTNCTNPAARRARKRPEWLPLIEVAIKQLSAPD